MRFLSGVTLAAGLFVPAVGVAGAADKPAASLDGTYDITGVNFYGKEMPAAELAKEKEAERTAVIKDGSITMMGKKQTFKADPSKSPAEIDFTATLPGGKTRSEYGIYKLDGDTLTVALGGDEPADRPKGFEPGKAVVVMTLKKR